MTRCWRCCRSSACGAAKARAADTTVTTASASRSSSSHDGGDYLIWEARSWRLDDKGDYREPRLCARRASGASVRDPDDPSESQAIELLLAHSTGYVELFYTDVRSRSRRGSW